MALELIEIKDFPRTTSVTGSGDELIVVSKADGKTYGIKTSDFKAFLGTVQSIAPRPISPTDPAPTLDGVYIPTVDGTYANAGGLVRDTSVGGVDEGMVVEFIKNGGVWVKSSYPLPKPFNGIPFWVDSYYPSGSQVLWKDIPWIASTDIIQGEEPKVSDKWKYLLGFEPSGSYRFLPASVEISIIDRPDLELRQMTMVNENMQVTEEFAEEKGQGYVFYDNIERPDLGFSIVDINNRLLYSLEEEDSLRSLGANFIEYENFDLPALNVHPGKTLVDLYNEWDELMSSKNNNPSYPNWITKSVLGKSSTMDLDILRFDFKPPNPKTKVFLTASTHGWEKNPTLLMPAFFKEVMNNWTKSKMLQWARWDVHWVVVPVVSPASYVPYPYGPGQERGQRCAFETDPIPATWSRSGNKITIEFNSQDFPDTGGRLGANDYFSHQGVSGKVYITVRTSSDNVSLKASENKLADGHLIETVINGRTIEVLADGEGDVSGTCTFHVLTDPARNWDTNRPVWGDYFESVPSRNKGTKPYSLSETLLIKELIDNESGIDLYIDNHSGSRKYYAYNGDITALTTPFDLATKWVSDFTDSEVGGINRTLYPAPYIYSLNKGITSYASEWDWKEDYSAEEATEEANWMFNLWLASSMFYTKKI